MGRYGDRYNRYDYTQTRNMTRYEVEQMFRDYDADMASDMDVMRGEIKWLQNQVRTLIKENERLNLIINNINDAAALVVQYNKKVDENVGLENISKFDPKKPL